MPIETIEQIAACVVTAGLVAGNFLLFTPWRDGHDPASGGLTRNDWSSPWKQPWPSKPSQVFACNTSQQLQCLQSLQSFLSLSQHRFSMGYAGFDQ